MLTDFLKKTCSYNFTFADPFYKRLTDVEIGNITMQNHGQANPQPNFISSPSAQVWDRIASGVPRNAGRTDQEECRRVTQSGVGALAPGGCGCYQDGPAGRQ